MNNSLSIYWSPEAIKDVDNLLSYLNEKWGNKITNEYIEILEININHIKSNPALFQLIYKKLKIRKCVISKENTIYFRTKNNQIEILRVFDTRQNPKKLEFAK